MNIETTPKRFCFNLAASLDMVAPAPLNVMQDANFLNLINSPENRAGWEVFDTLNIPGKSAPNGVTEGGSKIYMTYEKPYCSGGTTSTSKKLCDVDATTSEQTDWLAVDIDLVAERNFLITKQEFLTLCENPSERVAGMLRRKAYEIKLEINRKGIEALYAATGVYASDGTVSTGATAKGLTIISPDGHVIPGGFSKLNKEYRKANYKGNVIQFGGDTLASYFDLLKWEGKRVDTLTENPLLQFPFIYDNAFDEVFQEFEEDSYSHSVSLPLGSFIMQEHFKHTGENVDNMPHVMRNVMLIDGMEFDYGMTYDECGGSDGLGAWKIQIKKSYGFGYIPATAYCNDRGLTYHWLLNCGDFSCTDL